MKSRCLGWIIGMKIWALVLFWIVKQNFIDVHTYYIEWYDGSLTWEYEDDIECSNEKIYNDFKDKIKDRMK